MTLMFQIAGGVALGMIIAVLVIQLIDKLFNQ